MYCKHGGLRRQRTEDQAFISLHLQLDQIRKSFNTNVVSLNSSFSEHAASVKLFLSNVTHAYRPWQICFSVMYLHVLPFYNICSLTYFNIKIVIRVHKAENVLHTFPSAQCFFWVSVSMLLVFLILALYYACNILEIVGTT